MNWDNQYLFEILYEVNQKSTSIRITCTLDSLVNELKTILPSDAVLLNIATDSMIYKKILNNV